MTLTFAVLGGDARTERLCRCFLRDGHRLRLFALEKTALPRTLFADCCEAALQGADCAILPLPAEENGCLRAPFSEERCAMTEIFRHIGRLPLLGGSFCAETKRAAQSAGVRLFDYFESEPLQIQNALATAEGALALILSHTAETVCGTSCLIFGFGRIGKLMARLLQGLGAHVTVAARGETERAWSTALGYAALSVAEAKCRLGEFSVLVNTVPAPILDENALRTVRREAFCLDLASGAGGIDHAAAEALGLKCQHALALPGKFAPQSAAEAICRSVCQILEGCEVWKN